MTRPAVSAWWAAGRAAAVLAVLVLFGAWWSRQKLPDFHVDQRLRLQLENTKNLLDHFGKRFWDVTKFMLGQQARFDEPALSFDLHTPPNEACAGQIRRVRQLELVVPH